MFLQLVHDGSLAPSLITSMPRLPDTFHLVTFPQKLLILLSAMLRCVACYQDVPTVVVSALAVSTSAYLVALPFYTEMNHLSKYVIVTMQ